MMNKNFQVVKVTTNFVAGKPVSQEKLHKSGMAERAARHMADKLNDTESDSRLDYTLTNDDMPSSFVSYLAKPVKQ